MTRKRTDAKRGRGITINSSDDLEEAMQRVDSTISSIDPDLLATAALQCKAYARALMTLERLIAMRQEAQASEDQLQPYYDRLHLIYASLEEPDGMEGVSARVTSPSLEYQIREHESIGRWTSAQSCWELKLQQSPDDIDLHLGLLRCLRNLGHHGNPIRVFAKRDSNSIIDTLLTHIKGILTRHPHWESELSGLYAEGAAKVGDWNAVQKALESSHTVTPETTIASLLLALVNRDNGGVSAAFQDARNILGAPLTSGRRQSYRNLYDSIIHLHIVHELEMIYSFDISLKMPGRSTDNISSTIARLTDQLSARFESTQPSYSAREPLLSMRRTGFALRSVSN